MNAINKKILLFLILIMAIAVFFRFYKLAEIPPGLYPDVAINGTDALNALETGEYKVFYPENNGREGLFINLIALSFYFFGASVWAIKIVPAIIGILTVLGMYLLTKEIFCQIFNSKLLIINQSQNLKLENSDLIKNLKLKINNYSPEAIALLSSFFLSISFWHVNFSRLGFRAIMVPFILVWSFYFLFKAIHMKNKYDSQNTLYKILYTLYFVLAGLVFGLGFHTYISFRIAPLILGVVFLIEAYNLWQQKKFSSSNSQLSVISYQSFVFSWLLLFIAIIIAASPMILYFYNNPQDFMGRTGQVSVLASAQPLKDLTISTIKSLGMFNFWGDCNWRHNFACKPELPSAIGILFLLGFFRCLGEILKFFYQYFKKVSKREIQPANKWSFTQISFFLFIWFLAMLLPAILTNEGLPHSLRAIGVIPVVYIFAGIGGWWTINQLKAQSAKRKTIFYIFGAVFCCWFVVYSYDLYFIQWGKNPVVKDAFTQNYVDIGNYLNGLPLETKKYVIVNENGVPAPYPNGIPVPAQTIIFIEKTANKGDKTFYLKPEYLKLIQGVAPNIPYPIVYVLMKYDENILSELQKKMPQGEIKEIDGIWIFKVQN